jgi:hypothetical protein
VSCWAQACRRPEGLQLSEASLQTYKDDRSASSSLPFGRYDLLQAVGKCIAYLEAVFVQRPLKKERDRSTKFFVRVMILVARNWPHCVDGLWKMLVERLLPRSPVLALQHVLKLREGVDPGEFTFLCPTVKLGDRLVDGELDGVASVVFVDFNKVFVFGIVATQLVDLRQGVVVIPFLLALVERGTLVDGCHRAILVASCVLLLSFWLLLASY